jgi:diguanylate cyclase (GGDEF)-like protein
VVLLFCDLNGFKGVNDRLGHLSGDTLLTDVAARIRNGLRAGDTLARYGGDEFLVLCEDDAQEAAARRLTEHIAEVLGEPFELAGERIAMTASVGAVRSGGDDRADDLIRRADQAMYAAKQARRIQSTGPCPAVTEPAVIQPAVTQSTVIEPAVTRSAVIEPAVIQSAVTVPDRKDMEPTGAGTSDRGEPSTASASIQ